MRSMVEGVLPDSERTPPPRFARSPSPGNPGEESSTAAYRLSLEQINVIASEAKQSSGGAARSWIASSLPRSGSLS